MNFNGNLNTDLKVVLETALNWEKNLKISIK